MTVPSAIAPFWDDDEAFADEVRFSVVVGPAAGVADAHVAPMRAFLSTIAFSITIPRRCRAAARAPGRRRRSRPPGLGCGGSSTAPDAGARADHRRFDVDVFQEPTVGDQRVGDANRGSSWARGRAIHVDWIARMIEAERGVNS